MSGGQYDSVEQSKSYLRYGQKYARIGAGIGVGFLIVSAWASLAPLGPPALLGPCAHGQSGPGQSDVVADPLIALLAGAFLLVVACGVFLVCGGLIYMLAKGEMTRPDELDRAVGVGSSAGPADPQ